jgi:predicted PurR-regulated permease PerM
MSFPPPTPGQARVIWFGCSALAVAVIVAVVATGVWGLGKVLNLLSPVLWPLAVAGVIAYLLDPVVDIIERRGASRVRSIVSVFALAAVIVLGLAGSVVPQVVRETGQLMEKAPAYSVKLQRQAQEWINNPPPLLQKFLQLQRRIIPGSETNSVSPAGAPLTSTNSAAGPGGDAAGAPVWSGPLAPETLQSATGWLAKALPRVGSWLFGQVSKVASWFGVLAGLALIPVYAFYFLLEKEGIERSWSDYLPMSKSGFKDELVFVLQSINDYLIAFFRGQVMVALCDGVLYTIGFFVVGVPYAFLLGVMATLLTMIPFLGAIATCVTALAIAFVQFGDWLHPALVLAVFGVVQTLEGLVISPKILGDRVGLHPLAIIVAVMVGTTLLGGVLGGILAIPLTAALRVVMSRYVWKPRPASGKVS